MILALFFTRNVSLHKWVETGLFDREKLIYEEHLRQGHLKRVYWLTYGHDDVELAEALKREGRLHPRIEVARMPRPFAIKKLGPRLYAFLMPFIQRQYLRRADILKTNQVVGSVAAIIAKALYKKPLIMRSGFLPTLNSQEPNGQVSRRDYFICMLVIV